ncbi:hypothetical protein COV53_01880 [Candidatus Gottesmanbacteria bacterium CG11_big_fil_rev_8_21_14_0_20_37_11]|nr:MAG: hypothetical protein COX23_03045 [Candidatus Gottesmanbacteria bacterium CG23_combo_of_CG06-09_8_20_14_all_37_19]PIR08657.1 MAG: hypothetical protein COV53_01880 [Candidatus Gottesmanbacteria bacterium CG11_big_fil_rev_8_21_14_0_20_37_11]PIZ02220.1 MAG: hypothetical protein COY59_05985 [Candidatus Gottesmanbacteria bacterium CG_4_10_14_0_8_um_filter_37_24]
MTNENEKINLAERMKAITTGFSQEEEVGFFLGMQKGVMARRNDLHSKVPGSRTLGGRMLGALISRMEEDFQPLLEEQRGRSQFDAAIWLMHQVETSIKEA